MSKQQKGLRSTRAKPAWGRTWLRVLLILAVVALPLLAAGLANPAIRGGVGWKGVLQGMRKTSQGSSGDNGGGSGNVAESARGGRAHFGQLSVKLFNPITRSRLQADFKLKGISALQDGPELDKIIKNKYRFIREQATIAVRNCTAAELADPKLKLLERRVLIRINRSLNSPLLKSVDLAKFTLSESTPELDLMGADADEDH